MIAILALALVLSVDGTSYNCGSITYGNGRVKCGAHAFGSAYRYDYDAENRAMVGDSTIFKWGDE